MQEIYSHFGLQWSPFFVCRRQAYTVVTETLFRLLTKIRAPSSPAVPKKAGPPPQQQESKPDPKKDVGFKCLDAYAIAFVVYYYVCGIVDVICELPVS